MPLPYDALQVVRNEGVEFIGVVERNPFTTAVPACPGWTLADLAWHLGEVWDFWARVVEDHVTNADAIFAMPERERPADEMLIDWVTTAHTAIYAALIDARPEREVWTWTGANRDVEWVRRRMAQETAVHSWDASRAVGRPDDIDSVVAADGIDEFLSWFAGARRADGADDVGATVQLHCKNIAADWTVTSLDGGAEFTSGPDAAAGTSRPDATVSGRADDLLLWLWRRDGRRVEITGDAEAARRFRAYSDLG